MENFRNRFAPSAIWLFALAAIVLGVGTAFATKNLPPKIAAGVYAAIVGAAGFGAGFATRAKLRSTVGVFLVAAVVVGVGYYFLVSHIFSTAVTTLTDTTTAMGGDAAAKANGAHAAGVFGKFFGIFAGVVGFLETLIVGIGGAVAGNKLKEQSSSSMTAAHAR
ncbi:MAG TPA: hypothetical protein PLF40_03040 [Kofleriaceae bacterium]|mgnify:CR=1 FL=1|nr:hypothetical protein [Kofleriaceae bacterium]